MQPTPEEVRAALERVLASGSFAATTRLSRFLRFVVEQSLEGKAERLKEYVIGVEVFDRDERYDPRIDSIVRVEAGRLRAKLEEYYRGVGADDGVAIVLEKGSYAPGFMRRVDVPRLGPPSVTSGVARSTTPGVDGGAPSARRTAAAVTGPSVDADARRATLTAAARQRFAIAAVVVVIAATLVVGAASWRGARSVDPVSPKIVVAVLPFTTYSGDADARMIATRLTDSVTAELVRLGRFSVVASSATRLTDSRAPPHDIARDLHADLLLQARVNAQDGTLKVDAIVVDGARDRKLWFETLTGDSANLDDLARRVAAAAAASPLTAPP